MTIIMQFLGAAKLIEKSFVFILLVITTISCNQLGTCDKIEQVRFRNISFHFPIKASSVVKYSGKMIHARDEFVQTDSIMTNISASWYYEEAHNKYTKRDSANFLKDASIYAVTFTLWNELEKSDAEIINELQSSYPGKYEYVNEFGSQYYINRRDCLTIIYKREPFLEKPFPSVSFCYGFSYMQGSYYGHLTGNKAGFD